MITANHFSTQLFPIEKGNMRVLLPLLLHLSSSRGAEGTMCMAKDRDLEDLWSPMVGASADKVLVFVRMLGAPSRGGSSEPIDCTVAEWNYPDPAVDLTRRAAPAMGSGGAQDLPDRGPAIVYCSLYAAVRT